MTYEYVCQACGHQWEAQQPISADPLKDCPACGEAEAKRQISLGGGFILKGGGWYADLYSSSGAKSSSAGESKSESKSETKSDSGSTGTASASSTSSTPTKSSDSVA